MKKMAMLALTLALCLATGCACALTATGLETDAMGRTWSNSAFFTRMAALTGVDVQGKENSDEATYQKLLAGMQQGDVQTDVLFKAQLSRAQEIALLNAGAIVDLAPYIAAHMPNLNALLEEHPQWKQDISLPDGRIASLPLFNEKERQVILWINKTWLDALGIAMPTTLSEMTDALTAIRDRDPNGNGRKDEVPLDMIGVYEMRWLLPYFGVVADDYNLARDTQGQIVFAPELPGYRDFIAQLKAWRDMGLLRKDAFTAMHSADALSDDEDETVYSGMMLTVTPYTHVPVSAVEDYVPLLLAGPDGSVRWRDLLGEVWTGCFAVTSACDDVGAALRWADALYGEAGALLAYAGEEGTDYATAADGSWTFLTGARRDITDISAEALIYTGAAVPGLYPADFIHRIDSPADRHVFAASEQVRAVSERVMPVYALDEKAQAQADALAAELGAQVDRGIARFVIGETTLTDESYAAWLTEMKPVSDALTALFQQAE